MIRLLAVSALTFSAASYGEINVSDILNPEVMERGVVDSGSPARVMRALEKARQGEALVVGTLGGSITAGAVASEPEKRWANRVAQWWRETFPEADVSLKNAGIGATGSCIGAHRVEDHLLEAKPDIVFLEYAVNDSINTEAAESMEGLVRRILSEDQRPAVVLLYTMNQQGGNMQDVHTPVGKHYGLPMVSYRDALYPEVEAGRIAWEDIAGDEVHPNDAGHACAAGLLTHYLEGVLHSMPAGSELPQPAPLPEPLHSDRYQYARMLTANEISPLADHGWKRCASPHYGEGWRAEEPGSVLTFEVEAETISVLFYRVKGDMGIAEAWVDEGEPVQMDAWFNADWGGFTPFQLVGKHLGPGPHKLTIRLTDETHPQSNGHAFEVRGIMAAGRP